MNTFTLFGSRGLQLKRLVVQSRSVSGELPANRGGVVFKLVDLGRLDL